jgi:hypothetical protein
VALTAAKFLVLHPEFDTAPQEMVQNVIAEASRQLNPDVYGDKLDDAHRWLTAHLLTETPFGKTLRQADDDKPTVYFKEYNAIRKLVAPRVMVT